MDTQKWQLVGFLALVATICSVGAFQKLRDGVVNWRWNDSVSERHGRDPFGYWFSVSVNVAFAVVACLGIILVVYGAVAAD